MAEEEQQQQESEFVTMIDDHPVSNVETELWITSYLQTYFAFVIHLYRLVRPKQEDGQPEDAGGEPIQLEEEIEDYISAMHHFYKTDIKQDLYEQTVNDIRTLLIEWNRFLQREQGEQGTSAIISSDIKDDIMEFIRLDNISSEDRAWFQKLLVEWNDFLLARQGESPVSKCGVILTAVGLLCYVVDMVSDIGTAMYYLYHGQWWKFAMTLFIVYLAVTITTALKWLDGSIECTGPLDKLRYFGSLLLNWPDLQQYWLLLQLELKLFGSLSSNTHLIVEWWWRRQHVAGLKFTEGLCEACPQAILQLILLLPELNGDLSWSVSIRMVSTAISLCTAGAVLVNWEKLYRIEKHNALSLKELVVLHVWVVPVTVSRLLCLALLLSVHLTLGLVFIVLHLVLYGIYWCSTKGITPTFGDIFDEFLLSVLFLVSPFTGSDPHPSCAMRHVIHFLDNTGMMMVWALSTPLVCTRLILYVAIITIIFVMFIVGLLGWVLHRKYWQHGVQENN